MKNNEEVTTKLEEEKIELDLTSSIPSENDRNAKRLAEDKKEREEEKFSKEELNKAIERVNRELNLVDSGFELKANEIDLNADKIQAIQTIFSNPIFLENKAYLTITTALAKTFPTANFLGVEKGGIQQDIIFLILSSDPEIVKILEDGNKIAELKTRLLGGDFTIEEVRRETEEILDSYIEEYGHLKSRELHKTLKEDLDEVQNEYGHLKYKTLKEGLDEVQNEYGHLKFSRSSKIEELDEVPKIDKKADHLLTDFLNVVPKAILAKNKNLKDFQDRYLDRRSLEKERIKKKIIDLAEGRNGETTEDQTNEDVKNYLQEYFDIISKYRRKSVYDYDMDYGVELHNYFIKKPVITDLDSLYYQMVVIKESLKEEADKNPRFIELREQVLKNCGEKIRNELQEKHNIEKARSILQRSVQEYKKARVSSYEDGLTRVSSYEDGLNFVVSVDERNIGFREDFGEVIEANFPSSRSCFDIIEYQKGFVNYEINLKKLAKKTLDQEIAQQDIFEALDKELDDFLVNGLEEKYIPGQGYRHQAWLFNLIESADIAEINYFIRTAVVEDLKSFLENKETIKTNKNNLFTKSMKQAPLEYAEYLRDKEKDETKKGGLNQIINNLKFAKLFSEVSTVQEESVRNILNGTENIKEILEQGTNYFDLLNLALEKEATNIINLLLKQNVDKDIIRAIPPNRKTPLHYATEGGNVEFCKEFIQKFPNSIEQGTNYFDLLNLALKKNAANIADLLLEQNVDKAIVFKQASGKKTPLHLAAESGNVEFCEKFIQKFPNLIEQGTNYFDLLNLALEKNATNIVNLLLEQNVNKAIVFKQASGKKIPLHYATEGGNVEFCKKFIQKFPNSINHQDERGWTASYYSAKKEDLKQVINNLKFAKLFSDVSTAQEESAINILNDTGNIKEILEQGTNYFDLLNLALEKNATNIVNLFVNLLLEQNVDKDIILENFRAISPNTKTPLHRAAESGNLEFCKKFIQKFPNLIEQGTNYFDLLNLALEKNATNIVNLLLEQNVDKDIILENFRAISPNTKTPLHRAAESGNLEFCKEFIQKFSDLINHQDETNCTALHRATIRAKVEVVRLLLDSGADKAIKNGNKWGITAAGIAKNQLDRPTTKEYAETKENMQEILELLEPGLLKEFQDWLKSQWTIIVDKWNNSFLAGFCCSADAVDDADISSSPNNNSKTNPSSSVEDEINSTNSSSSVEDEINSTNSSSSVEDEINLTAVKQQLDSFLKDKNSISKASLEQNYFNLLNSALEENNMTAVHLLLKEDVDINAVLKQAFGKEIPLHLAAKSGNLEFCKKFIQKFPNSINHQDEGGWTALHFATFYYKKKVARLLIDSGANMTIKNRMDFTPAEIYTKFNPGDSPNVFFEPKESEAFYKRDTCNIL